MLEQSQGSVSVVTAAGVPSVDVDAADIVQFAPSGVESGGTAGRKAKPRRKRVVRAPNDAEWLVPMESLCEVQGLPLKWVRRKASEGELPCMRIGPRLLFNVAAVKKHLKDRACRFNQDGEYVR